MQTSIRTQGNGESAQQDLPFTLKDIKAAIPDYCFQPSVFRSLAYFFLDLGIIAGLYAIAAYLDSWFFYPIFWFAQGTMFWALFVVGHDCGHGSFSKSKLLNNIIGHLSHAPILVPFHGWRISHRTHHSNTGNIDTDESWYPVTESRYDEMGFPEKLVRFYAPLIAYPVYLFNGRPGGSHFNPKSPLFKPSEKNDILTSSASMIIMVSFLGWFAFQFGAIAFFKFYFVPYVIFVMWLDLVTYLHHTEDSIPWYRGDNWYYLKGALSTIDRDYGIFNNIHHNIGTHVAHHIFHTIPHYYLKDATEAVKPILGDHYRISHEPIWKSFFKSQQVCHYVPDNGDEVYYHPSK